MPRCDVTAGHYYSQLMTTAHASCHWPAAARFTEHGQLGIVTGYRPTFKAVDHAHCSVTGNNFCTFCRNLVNFGSVILDTRICTAGSDHFSGVALATFARGWHC